MPTASRTPVRVTDTRYGQLRHFEFDDPIGHSLEVYGEWAQAEVDFLARFIAAGDCVVDVGANIGTHTVAFAALVGPAGRVVAIEPQPEVFGLLRENVEGNGLAQVEVRQVAVSDEPGTARLVVPDYTHRHNSGTASLAGGGAGRGVDVQCLTLDDLELPRCAVLKMDIEGWEDRALLGARALLQRCRPLVYAECNSIEAGWRLLEVSREGYAAWLHAPPAFNEANYGRQTENIFGVAQETNLVLVPRERLAELAPRLKGVPHLDVVETLDDLAQAFLRAARYGEQVAAPERAVALARRLAAVERDLHAQLSQKASTAPVVEASGAPARAPALTRPVTVIVPVYNGFDDFQRLVESLFLTHAQPTPLLRFVFIDDASPDPRVAAFLEDPVFQRPDVTLLHNPRNLGFIGTVNRGLERYSLSEDGTDIIILNTDTLVYGNVFAILQDVAGRLPNVASVTPWSNNATIASLLNWPHGGDLFGMMEPAEVSRVVEAAAVPTPLVDAPTGVGFCMYMTRAAVLEVGGFDPAYGRGYGEENNWCQHAARRGFVNLMCTEAFVYHHGSASFGDDTRKAQLERNLRLLASTHPNYHRDVADYLEADPLREARKRVLWAVRRHYRTTLGLRTVLYALHTDPSYFGGGTEKHVMALTDHLLGEGRSEVLHLYPDRATNEFVLRAYFPRAASETQDSYLMVARFPESELYELLRALAPEVDTLHVHHFLGWPRWLTRAMPLFAHAHRLLTLHDYYAICPSLRLVSQDRYCDLPRDEARCNACLQDVHRLPGVRMGEWRTVNAAFLEAFDLVLTPSEAARRELVRGFSQVAAPGQGSLAARAAAVIRAVPNFVLDLPEVLPPPRLGEAAAAARVVYLGAYSTAKGARVFEAAAAELQQRGWTLEVWGTLGADLPPGVTHREYRDSASLRELGARFPVDLVVLPATWPETFSFTTFEAALDLRAPVVVGPYGNPAEVVRKHGLGVVLKALEPAALVEAVAEGLARRAELMPRVVAFEQEARRLTLENYLRQVAPTRAPSGVRPPPRDLPRPTAGASRVRGVPDVEDPLRHRLVDQTNQFMKTRLPWVHVRGKQLGKWVLQKVRG